MKIARVIAAGLIGLAATLVFGRERSLQLTLAPRSMLGPGVIVYNLARITLLRGANVSQHCHLCAGTQRCARRGTSQRAGSENRDVRRWFH